MLIGYVCDTMLKSVDLCSLPVEDREFLDNDMRTFFGLAPDEGSRDQIFKAMCAGYFKNMRDTNSLAYDVVTSECGRDEHFCYMLATDVIKAFRIAQACL